MRKILTIAKREYLAGVRTKAFLVSLILMPVMMGGSIGLSALSKKLDDTSEKTYAVVDRSPGGKIAAALEADAVLYNTVIIKDPATGQQIHPALKIEVVPPSEGSDIAIRQQRFELSERSRKNEIEAFIEIGPDIYQTRTDPNPESAEDVQAVRLQSKKPGEGFLGRYQELRLNRGADPQAILRELMRRGAVRQFEQTRPNLHDIFVRIADPKDEP